MSVLSEATLDDERRNVLAQLAKTYIWWKSPEEALLFPARIASQVMNIGDWDDVALLAQALGDDALREVLQHASAGEFNARSWHYWHYRLGLASPEQRLPPLPKRRLA
ncbi:MAG: hypothetical protein ACYDGW_04060 [Vulcanimicrobiaceae bacterium]